MARCWCGPVGLSGVDRDGFFFSLRYLFGPSKQPAVDSDLSFSFSQVFVPVLQGNQVLPDNCAGLDRGWAAGVSPRLQHAEPPHPSQESQLPASGLQLQPQARQGQPHRMSEQGTLPSFNCFSCRVLAAL